MLAPTEPGVHVITAKVATQLLKTSLLENVFGYHAHLDPCPQLLVQPKEDAAEKFSKERITPMIEATPVLKGLVGSSTTRNSDDTLRYKAFPGGFLALEGAGSPQNLASRPIRIVMYDETDKYPPLIEGDTFDLADERTASFQANWLSIRVCSPTLEDESRIDASYQASDQRKASVGCPHCGHRMFLSFFDHVHWEKTEAGEHRPKTAAIFCEACGVAWSEADRLRAVSGPKAAIRWHQTRPFTCCGEAQVPLDAYRAAWQERRADPVGEVWSWWESRRWAVYRAKCRLCGAWPVDNEHAGFQASKLYSPWTTKDGPVALAKKWLAARKDDEKRKTFVNTQLAEVYKVQAGKEVSVDRLMERREVFAAEVPDGVAVVTVGCDFQAYRVEIEVVGWGRDEESWSIRYHVIEGEFSDPSVQAALDEFLKRTWKRGDGRVFSVAAACLDSGHHTEHVYRFARARLGRKIWAIKGASEKSGQRSPVWPTKRLSAKSKQTFRPVLIGVNAAKDVVSSRLAIELPKGADGAPGYMHFPADSEAWRFEHLTAEKLVPERINGQLVTKWVQKSGRANEGLDCRVYAYAALCGLTYMNLRLDRRADEVGAARRRDAPRAQPLAASEGHQGPIATPPPPRPPPAAPSVSAPAPPRGGGSRRAARISMLA